MTGLPFCEMPIPYRDVSPFNLLIEVREETGAKPHFCRSSELSAVVESAKGREQIARHHLCVLAFKIVNRLLGKIDAGGTDRQYQKRTFSRIAAAARRTSATSFKE
jgi:hypothetical protein